MIVSERLYFELNNVDFVVKERPMNIMEIWDGPQMIRDELVRLEIIIEETSKKFGHQLIELISLQQDEFDVKY